MPGDKFGEDINSELFTQWVKDVHHSQDEERKFWVSNDLMII